MAASFVDTSALLKLYIVEVGSQWMHAVIRPLGITISALALAEVGTALSRSARDRSISEREARIAWRKFRREVPSFAVMPLEYQSLVRAANLTARSPVVLRTLDAIHLQGGREAAAIARGYGLPQPQFISADARLLAAAQALGFATDNPLNHP